MKDVTKTQEVKMFYNMWSCRGKNTFNKSGTDPVLNGCGLNSGS